MSEKNKQKLIQLLEDNEGNFVSGSMIAEELGITRAAVWKNIKTLEDSGYKIEAVNNRGYRFSDDNDMLTEGTIKRYMGACADIYSIEIQEEVTSTNDMLKERAGALPGWHAMIASRQTAGKGRRGRNFYSPSGSGLYLSILLKLPVTPEIATRFTTAAAVAACRAIEACTDRQPKIKWVNDVYIDGKKVCGILTEASISMESGGLDWAVMGIGFNVYEPEGGFPQEIADIAGCISLKRQKDLRSRLAAEFMKAFYDLAADIESGSLAAEYKKRSFMIGLPIMVLRGCAEIPAVAEDIDEECRLIVRYVDGRKETLSSGEVSTRVSAK